MPDKNSWLWNISFKWRGRTKEGVSRWAGSPTGPPGWFGKIFLGWGMIAGAGGLVALLATLITHNPALTPLIVVGLIHGVVFGLTGAWALHLRRKIARLKSVEDLAQEFGTTPELVRRLAEEHSIRPQININDINRYNPEEFIASQILLRAASAPVTPETLLRAAEPTTPQSAPETLLRPLEPVLEAETPTQDLSASANLEGQHPAEEDTENAIQELRH